MSSLYQDPIEKEVKEFLLFQKTMCAEPNSLLLKYGLFVDTKYLKTHKPPKDLLKPLDFKFKPVNQRGAAEAQNDRMKKMLLVVVGLMLLVVVGLTALYYRQAIYNLVGRVTDETQGPGMPGRPPLLVK